MNESPADRARRIATEAYDASRWAAGTAKKDDRDGLRQGAAICARVAETLATLDLADAQRELAASNDRLSLSYDSLTDEMRRRRGIPAQTA